jgi:hypothetical protein
MMPVVEVGPVIDVTISVAHAAATEDRRGAKAATMDRNAATSEPAAMERSTAAPESAAMKTAAAAAKAAASTTAKPTTAAMTAMPDFGRQIVDCKFRCRRRAGTGKRERLGALL